MEIIPADNRIEDCILVRRRVFVEEQGIDISLEIDERDEPESGCSHFLMIEDGRPVGTFRAYFEDEETIHLQRFCILADFRGRGFGRDALRFIEGYYTALKVKKITFGAQVTAIPFYERCGYTCVSDFFPDAGIPHRTMEKRLSPLPEA
jgi:predicted GNAT family N-acyltransferase